MANNRWNTCAQKIKKVRNKKTTINSSKIAALVEGENG